MKSPFPGMDPYLEKSWRDVHQRLVIYISDMLQPRLPGDLRARVEERVFVEPLFGPIRGIYPDIRVVEHGRRARTSSAAEAGIAVAEPFVMQTHEEASEGFIEIIDVGSGGRVVTVIEVLSLSNKIPGDGQDKYLQKQRELLQGRVSLVEIDLLRAGKRVLGVPFHEIPLPYRTTYQITAHRGWKPFHFEIYRAPLREPLPTIRVPLRESDPDAVLELQKLVDMCYANGGYDDIDYRVDPDPPLDPEDAAWADELLRRQGLRGERAETPPPGAITKE
jgi:hypothetical protein